MGSIPNKPPPEEDFFLDFEKNYREYLRRGVKIGQGSIVCEYDGVMVPEISLIYAVLERAIADAISNERGARKDAIKWFFSRRDGDWSFKWVCETLNLSNEMAIKLRRFVSATITRRKVKVRNFEVPEES